MEEIKFCPHCGEPNSSSSKFCGKCGATLLNESVPTNTFHNSETYTNEPPVVEKSKYTSLNYSQVLRRLLFINPMPIILGGILSLILLAEILMTYFLSSEGITTSFYISIAILGLNLCYLFYYLVIFPIITVHRTNSVEVTHYHISFFKDKLQYELSIMFKGNENRSNFFLKYNDIIRFREYKDMIILAFNYHGQLIPLCIVKDEFYEKIVALFQYRLDALRNNKPHR